MERKYYTPTCEEFHVGFEYEFKDWHTQRGQRGQTSEVIQPVLTEEEIAEELEDMKESNRWFQKTVVTKAGLWNYDLHSMEEVKSAKAIHKDPDFNPNIGTDYRHEWERITTGIIDGTVRVKCLDIKDVESLGFRINDKAFNYHIMIDNNGNSLTIYPDGLIGIRLSNDRRWVFYGKVKNKSELKRILNQVL